MWSQTIFVIADKWVRLYLDLPVIIRWFVNGSTFPNCTDLGKCRPRSIVFVYFFRLSIAPNYRADNSDNSKAVKYYYRPTYCLCVCGLVLNIRGCKAELFPAQVGKGPAVWRCLAWNTKSAKSPFECRRAGRCVERAPTSSTVPICYHQTCPTKTFNGM